MHRNIKIFKKGINQNLLAYQELQRQHERFGKKQGINVQGNSSNRDLVIFIIMQLILHFNNGITIGFALTNSGSTNNFLGLCVSPLVLFVTTLNSISGILIFKCKDDIGGLLSFCEEVSKKGVLNENRLFKVVKIIHNLKFVVPLNLTIGTAILTLVVNERILPFPLLYPAIVKTDIKFYTAIFLIQIVFDYVIWQLSIFVMTTYIIVTQHILAEYEDLQAELLTINTSLDAKIYKKLEQIGGRHSNLLKILNDTSEIFKMPLLLTECQVIFGYVMCGITLFISSNALDLVFAGVCGGFSAMNLIYPVLGERISSSAEKFEAAIYEVDWLAITPRARKELTLMLKMAQKPVGISTGGFHFCNHMEIAQVRNERNERIWVWIREINHIFCRF